MFQTADGTTYKSRLKVLLEFFRRSRNRWKDKCLETKAALKKTNNRSRWLETSRDQWKARASELESQLQAIREEQKPPPRSGRATGRAQRRCVRLGTVTGWK